LLHLNAASLLQDPRSTPSDVQTSALDLSEHQGFGLERETGFEPATLSLGIASAGLEGLASFGKPAQSLDARDVPAGADRRGLAGVRSPEAPQEPHGTAQHARGDTSDAVAALIPPRRLRSLSGGLLTVREVAAELKTSTAAVYRLCERGDLAHVRVSNAVRIAPADLAAYLRRSRVER
jgi:excisionase family DNA binding protein